MGRVSKPLQPVTSDVEVKHRHRLWVTYVRVYRSRLQNLEVFFFLERYGQDSQGKEGGWSS